LSETDDINELSQTLNEQVSGELSRFRDITVIGYYTIEMTALIRQNILEAARSLGADYIITGSLQYYGQSILTRMNLLKTRTGEVIMTHSFEKNILPSGILEIQDEIVHNVIGEVCGHFRVILQQRAKDSSLKVPVITRTEKRIYNNFKLPRAYTTESIHTA
jgi:TolB-like protein